MTLLNSNRASGAAIAFIVGSVVFAVLTVAVKLSISVPSVDADRDVERGQALAQMRANEYTNLTVVGWVDEPRGIVRLPIETALQIAEKQGAASLRATLIWREDQASAPAPVRPAKAHGNSGDVFE